MVSVKNMLNDTYWKIALTLHTDASDKYMGTVIRHNKKTNDFY